MTAPPPPIGIVTVSDRASRGAYPDRGGPAVIAYLEDVLATPFTPESRLIPDEADAIRGALLELCDDCRCPLVVTTGGTGPAPRDITPELTESVCERMLPGFGEQMRVASLRAVPTAILSRQTAGIRGQSLIINLPGKPSAIAECLDAIFSAVPYAIDLIGGPRLETRENGRVSAFRPRSAPAAE